MCTVPSTTPICLRFIGHENIVMTHSGSVKKCNNDKNKAINITSREYAETSTKSTNTRQEVSHEKSSQNTNKNITSRPSYPSTKTNADDITSDTFEEKKDCISTSQNVALEHQNNSANLQEIYKFEHKKSNSNVQIQNNCQTVKMHGKITDKGENCENYCNSDGNQGDGSLPEENNVKSDSDSSEASGLSSDSIENCGSTSPVLTNFVEEDPSVLDATTNLPKDKKQNGKRRYYMWGSHKLVKPIKDIPLRFQILLAESNAARIRCEGQPIYMLHQDGQQEQWNDNLMYPPKESSQFLSTDSCVSSNETGVCQSLSPEVSFYQESGYANNVHSNGDTTCDSLFIPQNVIPVYELGEPSGPQNMQKLVVYSPNSSSTHLVQTQCLPIQSVSVGVPSPAYPPPEMLSAHQMSQITTASYFTPPVCQTLSNSHSQSTMAVSDDQKIVQSYHTVTTNKWPAPQNNDINLESLDHHHKPQTNHITSPSQAIPLSSNCTLPKYSRPVYAPFSHLSTPPPNFPTPITGSFTPNLPVALPPNCNPILISVPHISWVMQCPCYVDHSFQKPHLSLH